MKTANNKLGETFYQLTEEEAREWYRLKYINTTAYLLVIKRLLSKPSSSLTIPNVLDFCRHWDISKSAFYRAVDTLRSDNKFTWEATQGVILTPCQKVVTIPRAGHHPTSGTPSHERDTDSHERDTDSHERDTDSHERDTDIYIDRARDRSITDLSRSITDPPLTPQGEKEGEGNAPLQVEIVPEEQPACDFVAVSENSKITLWQELELKQEKSSGACDNSKQLQRLVEKFEAGEITKLPPAELRLLSNAMIGDYVRAYRKSGNIICASPNDIETDFLMYVTENHLSSKLRNPTNAASRIRNAEQDPTQWRGLVEMVEGWHQRKSTVRSRTPEEKNADYDEFVAALLRA